jgi:hypothetical protein
MADQLRHLLTTKYWFDIIPSVISRTSRLFIAVAIIMLVAGVVAWRRSKKPANIVVGRLLARISAPLITFGILLGLWYAFRWQSVQFLGSHLVGWLILVIALLWLLPSFKYWRKRFKVEKEAWHKEQQKLKYLQSNK